jgi:hypothetical protein
MTHHEIWKSYWTPVYVNKIVLLYFNASNLSHYDLIYIHVEIVTTNISPSVYPNDQVIM